MYRGKYLNNRKAPRRTLEQKSTPLEEKNQIVEKISSASEALPTPEAPVTETNQKKEKKKKRIRVGTVIFYLFYLLLIGAFAMGMNYVLGELEDWLTLYEASQPQTKSQEIFDRLFSDPNWEEIYTLADLEDTKFESKEAYAAYMAEKIGDKELTFHKTSAGLSGGQKYIVKLDNEKLATFTIKNDVTSELEIPHWELATVEAFYSRDKNITINTLGNRYIYLNGVLLDDSYIIRTTASVVDKYLPEGLHGPRTQTVYADNFLVVPEVTVVDGDGNPVDVTYDAATNTYTEADITVTYEPDQEVYDAIITATQSYCRHMIGAGASNVHKYFDTKSEIYRSISKNEGKWFTGYSSYSFTDATLSEYTRYSDTLASARIQFTMNVHRNDGTVRPYEINQTLFVEKREGKGWLVINMTNLDVHQILTQVRMTYLLGDTVISSDMVSADEETITLPTVEVPEGKVFTGWFRESVDAEGNTTYSLVFAPTEESEIHLPSDYQLEPMVLHALFEASEE